MSRYIAIHPGADLSLSWDEATMRAKMAGIDFSTGHYTHVVDSYTGYCVGCGMSVQDIRAKVGTIYCSGPKANLAAGNGAYGINQPAPVHSHSTYNGAKGAYDTYSLGAEKQSNSIGIKRVDVADPPVEKEKLIAESAKPTTGIDWEAFKTFGRGL